MRLADKLYAVIQLWRPPLLVLGFIGALGLLRWSGISIDIVKSGLIVMTIGFANLGFNTMNELRDVEIDRVNKPWKPLPSGRISRKFALYSSLTFIILSVITLILLVTLFDPFYLIAIVGYFTSFVYSGLQKRDLLGNVCLGASYSIAGLISTYPKILQMNFALAFGLFTIAYNVYVQWQDMVADRSEGIVTLPIQMGNKAIIVSIILATISILLTAELFYLTGKLFLLLFIIATLLVVISTYGVKKDNKKFIEWTLRRGGRFLITLAFLWMIIFA